MARVTVYVPDELKARMDAAGELVNWSAEAQRAFDLALKQVEWRMGDLTEIEAAVARLRASKESEADQERREGRKAGREWALKYAEHWELKAVASLRSGEAEMADLIAYAVRADYREGEQAWWEQAAGEDVEITDAFAEGFREGAAEVWEEVADQL